MSPIPTSSRRRSARKAPSAPLPVYVFIAYGHVTAARDAIERVQQMLRAAKRDAVVQPMLWRFDQLGQSRWREMALHDASRAHAIVIAMGDAPTLDSGTDDWLIALIDRRTGAPITCVALMRGGEPWTISLERREARTNATAASRARELTRAKPHASARAA